MDKTAFHPEPSNGDALNVLLAAFSAGSLEPALHALIASHLALNPINRSFVAAMEELAATRLSDADATPLTNRDARLEAIFASSLSEERQAIEPDPLLPAPLRRYLGHGSSDLRWRKLLPGVREHRIEQAGRGGASLLRIKAGVRIPAHTHEGVETTLVLKGAFVDGRRRYARGDVAIADSEVDHRPCVEEGEDCFCFAVTDAPLHLTGPIGRIVDRFFGA